MQSFAMRTKFDTGKKSVCFLKRHRHGFSLTPVGLIWMSAQAAVELGNQHAKNFSQIHCPGARFSGPSPLAFVRILFFIILRQEYDTTELSLEFRHRDYLMCFLIGTHQKKTHFSLKPSAPL